MFNVYMDISMKQFAGSFSDAVQVRSLVVISGSWYP